MQGERLAHRLAAGVLWNQRGLAASLCGGHLGRELVFSGRGFEIFQLELHLIQDLLIDKLASAFGTAAIELPLIFSMASLRWAISASALETLAAARAAAASALAAFVSASMRATRSAARSRLRFSKSSGGLSFGITTANGAQIARFVTSESTR